MKKMILLLCIALCLVVCSACSDANNQTKPTTEIKTAISTSSESSSVAETELNSKILEPVSELLVTEEPTEEDDSAWKEAYTDYVSEMTYSSGKEKFNLLDLDNNGIPELFFDSGLDLGGGSVSIFANECIQTIDIGSGGIYYWNNCICNTSGRQGIYTTRVYKVSDGRIDCVFDGKQTAQSWNFDLNNPDDFTYSYRTDESSDYKSVSFDEYAVAFSEWFDKSQESELICKYDSSSIIDAIKNY